MRGLFITAQVFIVTTITDISEAIRGHFGNHTGGSHSGSYIRLPFTHLSALLEWREQSVGHGHQHIARTVEVFAARFQGVFCVEPSAV